MTPDAYEEICRLMQKHRIYFDGPVSQDRWPPQYKQLFATIKQDCGQKAYDAYKQMRKGRAVEEPWGADVLERAVRVVAKAERCRLEHRNEAGWRLSLEPEIFNRFTVEIAWYLPGFSKFELLVLMLVKPRMSSANLEIGD